MIKDPKQTQATRKFKTACDGLAKAFLKQIGISYDPYECWWVSDVRGDVFCFNGGEMFTNTEDMQLVIEHRLTWDEYYEYYCHLFEMDENLNNLPNRINLRSWIMGARPNEN